VTHEHWNNSFPPLECAYSQLDIKFSPKLICPEVQYVHESSPEYSVSCDILVNPIIPPRNITWQFPDGRIVTMDALDRHGSVRQIQNGIRASLGISKEDLRVEMHEKLVSLKVWGNHGQPVVKNILVQLLYEPQLHCPSSVDLHRLIDNVEEVDHKVTCRVLSNPLIPKANISWFLETNDRQKIILNDRQVDAMIRQTLNG
jgi:hypothetical protein